MKARSLKRICALALFALGSLAMHAVAIAKSDLPPRTHPVPAAAKSTSAYVVSADISGTWYDPAQSGHGFVVEHISVAGAPQLLVTWFTYLDGQPRWLFGAGTLLGNEARIPLSITSGADFPPDFVAGSASVQPWGELVLSYSSSTRGTATWTSSFAGFNNGSMPIYRLTTPASALESPSAGIAGCHAGAWYDPAQSGHGVFVEILGSGANRSMLAIWYTYLDGQQRWMTATGPISGNTATLSATITTGADFPPAFNAGDVVRSPWGTMTFTSVDASHATWQWNSTVAGYGSGSMNLTRLTSLSGRDCAPASDADAARFLTQASFGPTAASVSEVRTLGFPAWIAAQKSLPATLQRPTLEQQVAAAVVTDPRNASFYNNFRVERWFNTAVTAADQLRQRMAFALSQILVVSDVGTLAPDPIGVAEYNDILLRHALGNYRDLLREVTLSPVMGAFLTSLRNQKTDWTLDTGNNLVASLIQPDENYAREVMQLFSVGLIERNRDFSPIQVNGANVPTYTQDIVTDTAQVLTGWSYGCTGPATIGTITINRNCGGCVGNACNFSSSLFFSNPGRYAVPGTVTALIHPDSYKPMVCYPRYADSGRSATSSNNYATLPAPSDSKSLIAGISVPPSSVACHAGTTGTDQQACLNYCTAQIDTLVDALFLHPNTAPMIARQLIQRLTTSNPSPGYIDRVAAVFENDGSGVRGNLAAVAAAILLDPEARSAVPASDFGKIREPLLRLTSIWRAFGVQASAGIYGMFTPERFFAQRPLGAPSVFSFYEPDYQQPGEIADAGMYAPEFQILDESTTITTSDELWRRIFAGYSTANATTSFSAPAQGAYLSPTDIDALPVDNAGLVEALNQKLMFGAMSSTMKSKLVALLGADMATADKRRKALDMIHLIAISPEYALQR
jgi:uncharacterized protein (DUF1800 family)